jgi:hypothetical protein
MTQRNFGLSFFAVARNRDLVFIAISMGERHVALNWDIRVIIFCNQMTPNIS